MPVTLRSLRPTLRPALVLAAVLAGFAPLQAQPTSPYNVEQFGALSWRTIGPEGNRFSAAVGIPGDPLTYYVGAASGGIFKTTDGGVHWGPVFDDQPVQSIGALAVAPSDPNIVWAGTGESHIRSHISVGQGVYRSLDAGRSWRLMGLERTGRIARVLVHPTNPDVVLVCALGHGYGPQPERGVFRTTDGGASWTRVLFVDQNTGCSDLVIDPSNPRLMFAGMWQLEIHTWGRTSGGPGSGLFASTDGGITWTRQVGRGLPRSPVGKVTLATARSNPKRIFAMIETGDGIPWEGQPTQDGQLWRSDNGGRSWSLINRDRNVMGRPHYYSRMMVSIDNENEAWFLTASFAKSIDGGATVEVLRGQQAPGGDHHDMWIDPTDGDRMIVAHDQGLSISQNRGRTWFRQRLLNAQIYHVTVDNSIPYNVFGNKQDEPSYRGPSNSRVTGGRSAGISRGMWHSVGGGESGWATPDPTNPDIIWSSASGSGMRGGIVVRYQESRRQMRNVEVWPDQSNGPAAGVRYRFVWDAPLHISPHDPNTVYVGSQHLHRTRNGGQSWEVISPDLTLNDKSRQGSSGGLTGDNIGVEYAGTLHAIAESPLAQGTIWVGTNDGQVQLTRDDGASWSNLTASLPGLPAWGSVRSIVASRHDAATAYLVVDFHQVNGRDPFVYRTRDYGRSWTLIVTGIPKSMLSYARAIAEDPVRASLLYLGTENAIYVSFDAGDRWLPLQANLPHTPVSGIVVQERFNDLVISTYGRGFWIMDDITPLQQMTPEVLAKPAHLFPVREAWRFRSITAPSTTYDDPTTGENPAYGASINYWLKGSAKSAPTVTILDATGAVVRTLRGGNAAGLNRVAWNLEGANSTEVRLRTAPRYAPHLAPGAEGRSAPGVPRLALLMPPGQYTVVVTVDGVEQRQPVEVRKDPHSGGTEADIAAQTAVLSAIRADLERGAAAVHRIESMRVQLAALARSVGDPALAQAATTLEERLADLEMNLVELRLTGQGQDGVRFASALLSKFGHLANGLASADFRPTDQQLEVQAMLKANLERQLQALEAFVTTELGAFNNQLRAGGVPHVLDRP